MTIDTATAAPGDVPVVALDHVTRRFGAVTALDDVSLTVAQGELVGLLGPNGAGKTTLLSLVSGLRRPDEGTVRLFGRDPREPAARVRLGTTPQETGLPPTLTVREVVDLVAGHYPEPMPSAEVLGRFGLEDLARRQTGGLSGGQKRRLAVALALVGRPRLVLLDEPTTGLDVEARHTLWEALRGYQADGATIVLTSHYLEEVEALARRVVVVGGGRVLADDRLEAVVRLVGLRRVLLTAPSGFSPPSGSAVPTGAPLPSGPALPSGPVPPSGAVPPAVRGDGSAGALRGGGAPLTGASWDVADLAGLPGAHSVEPGPVADGGRRWTVLASDADRFVRALVERGVPFRDLEVRAASLEEAFLALTGASPDGGPLEVARQGEAR